VKIVLVEKVIQELRKYDNAGIMEQFSCDILNQNGTAAVNRRTVRVFFSGPRSDKKNH